MLLYDRIWQEALSVLKLAQSPHRFGVRNCQLLASMKAASVYQIDECAALLTDWDKGKKQPISKRPPADNVWCEWTYRAADHTGDFEIEVGAIISKVDKREIDALHAGGMAYSSNETVRRLSECLDVCAEAYGAYTFQRYLKCELAPGETMGDRQAVPTRNTILCDPEMSLWLGSENFSKVESFKLSGLRGTMTAGQITPAARMFHDDIGFEDTLFGLGIGSAKYTGDMLPVFRPWPAFLAFALLHCKNVVVDDYVPDAQTQRRAEKAGCPPRCTYKTLKIEVPHTVHKREGYAPDALDDGPKVRFHLCSGHFKNLQSERYKNKGWHWWPAHWRGSKELGEVHKTYSVHPRTEAGS